MTRPAAPPAAHDPIARIADFFERFSVADLARIAEVYTDDAYFKDPFNEVRGIASITAIYRHMFDTLAQPRFAVHDRIGDAREVVLTWTFEFRRASGTPMAIRGASHLRLDAQGRIAWHRDYWDAAEELYEKLPLVGTLMRWLKRRATS